MAINITNYLYDLFPPLNPGGSVPFPNVPPEPGQLHNPPKVPPIQGPGQLQKIIPPPIKPPISTIYNGPLPGIGSPGQLEPVKTPGIPNPGPVTSGYNDLHSVEDEILEGVPKQPRFDNLEDEPLQNVPKHTEEEDLESIGSLSIDKLKKDLEHRKVTELIDFIAGTSITQVDIENLRLKDLGIAYGAATRGLTLLEDAKSLIKKGVDVGIPHDSRHQLHLLGNRAMGDKKRMAKAEEELIEGKEQEKAKYRQYSHVLDFESERHLEAVFSGEYVSEHNTVPNRTPQTKTSPEYPSLKKIHTDIEADLVTNKYLMVSIVSTSGESVQFPFVVEDMIYSPESNLAAINVLWRNLQKYHFTSSEDTLEMRIIWNQRFSFPGKGTEPWLINRALKIASFAKKTGKKVNTVNFNVNSRTSLDIFNKWFPIFDPGWNYLLMKAPIKILETHYINTNEGEVQYNSLPIYERHSTPLYPQRGLIPMKFEQTLVLKRVSQTDVSGKEIYAITQ